LWADSGGIGSLSSKIRLMIALESGSPGTIGTTPPSVATSAASRTSSRMPASRVVASLP
jgi:hypothetical protein